MMRNNAISNGSPFATRKGREQAMRCERGMRGEGGYALDTSFRRKPE